MKLNRKNVVLLLGAVVLFFAYAWFPITTRGSWNAPDELAVAYFSQEIPLLGGDYNLEAAYSEDLGGLVHPRSAVVVDGKLVPSMWLGMPWLIGVVSRITGFSANFAQLIVPLLAVLAVSAWYFIVSEYTEDSKLAIFTAIALAIHPGWWYFTARGLHPNVLFLSMLIFAMYFWYVALHEQLTKRPDLWREAMMFLGGFSAGMAIFIRTNEAIWVLPVLLYVLWISRKMFTRELAVAIVGFLIPIAIMFNLNSAIYGSGLINGYNVSVDPVPVELAVATEQAVNSSALPFGLNIIFPFGIHETNIMNNFINFHFVFFAFWTFFTFYGFLLLAIRWRTFDKQNIHSFGAIATIAVAISVYLIVLYGSWNVTDNIDPNAVTIGVSYIRYWLPITLFMTPFIGYAFATGFSRKRKVNYQVTLQVIWVIAFILVGARLTLFGTGEGLAFITNNLKGYNNERDAVLGITSYDDLIIVDRSDKILFPYRNVIVPLRSETTYSALPLIMDTVEKNDASLYYYGITLPPQDIQYLKDTKLQPFNLDIGEIETVNNKTLYKITRD